MQISERIIYGQSTHSVIEVIGVLETGLVLMVYQRLPSRSSSSFHGFNRCEMTHRIHVIPASHLQMSLTSVLMLCLVVLNGSANLSLWMRHQMRAHFCFTIVMLWIAWHTCKQILHSEGTQILYL
jgi:hypothetical protein